MERVFLMRWNPAISSYKLDVYHRNCKDFPDGFQIDWSVWEYEVAHSGDYFVMMRVGDYKPGIVFYGEFVSDPYTDDDWAGTEKKRHYVLMDCFGFNNDDNPIINAGELCGTIPEIDWMCGHSGVVLDESIAERLVTLLNERMDNFSFTPTYIEEDDYSGASERLAEVMNIFADFNPSIHSKNEEEFDWLESDEDWCRCLLIPNPFDKKYDIEIETDGDFILCFAGSHGHYENDEEDFHALINVVSGILKGNLCAYSLEYDGWGYGGGLTRLQPSSEEVKEFLLDNQEDRIRMLAKYTEKIIKLDGVLTVEFSFFNPSQNKRISFQLEELSDKITEYQKRQAEVIKLYGV